MNKFNKRQVQRNKREIDELEAYDLRMQAKREGCAVIFVLACFWAGLWWLI